MSFGTQTPFFSGKTDDDIPFWNPCFGFKKAGVFLRVDHQQ